MARWRGLWHLPSLCVGGVRGRRARRPSEQQAKSPRSQLSGCRQSARTAPRAPSGTSRRRVGRATRAIFRPASPSQWDLAKLPLGGADAPTRSPSGSFARSQWEFRKSQWELQSAPRKASGSGEAALAGSHSDLPLGGAPLPCARHFLWGTFLHLVSLHLQNLRVYYALATKHHIIRKLAPFPDQMGP